MHVGRFYVLFHLIGGEHVISHRRNSLPGKTLFEASLPVGVVSVGGEGGGLSRHPRRQILIDSMNLRFMFKHFSM